MEKAMDRRQFVKCSLVAGMASPLYLNSNSMVAVASQGSPSSSANGKVTMAIAGMGGRGKELLKKFQALPDCQIKYLVDADQRVFEKALAECSPDLTKPKVETDFRRVLEDKDVDGMIIATPDHWHAPMAIAAVNSGKHVYVEKPCSHNPHEGEMLVQAARKHGRLVQMGSQRRSVQAVQQMVEAIQKGLIGRVYLAQCFYSRKRDPIGFGKSATVPSGLNWDLWQGPAPRTSYRDNVHPYNWHWFWNWGTGEALNNGVHLLDVARWALKLEYPKKVTSMGGRWHYRGVDDWQCPDTQEILLEFTDGQMLTWFGRSVNTFDVGYKGNGILFMGEGGTIDYNGNEKYSVFDLDNKKITDVVPLAAANRAGNTLDPGLGDYHAQNFLEAIQGKAKLTAPIEEAHISTTLGHLGNISLRVGQSLVIDKTNGHILENREAQGLWKRVYEAGWEPKV